MLYGVRRRMKYRAVDSGDKLCFSVNPLALLAVAAAIYFADAGTLIPFLKAVLWHEMGHLSVLLLFGCRIEEIKLELGGLCIRYAGAPGACADATAALAGPLAGLLYAFSAARTGPRGELSAALSIWLSAFNMIPALPLDGGRVIDALFGPTAAGLLGMISAAVLAVGGLILFFAGKGISLAMSGILLLAYQVTLISKAP